jgi:hypothetical protein
MRNAIRIAHINSQSNSDYHRMTICQFLIDNIPIYRL